MGLVKGLVFTNLRGDLYGGVTAGIVALSLALAFGVSSGAGDVASHRRPAVAVSTRWTD